LAKKRNYEKLFYLKTIRRGQTVLDLGANRGFFAYLFAALTGSKGKVHCFEPVAENLKLLQANVSAFTWVKIHPFAVGEKNMRAEISYSLDDLEKATLHPELIKSHDEVAIINLVALDEYEAKEDLFPIHFIKCDVEGHELKALKGMSSILREFHPKLSIEITISGNERKELFKLLMENGYNHFQKIEENYPLINPTSEIPKDSYFYLYAACTLVT
jgi:FkbM family methyltransferase